MDPCAINGGFEYPTLHNKKQLCVIKCIASTRFNENFKIINCNKLIISNCNCDFNRNYYQTIIK